MAVRLSVSVCLSWFLPTSSARHVAWPLSALAGWLACRQCMEMVRRQRLPRRITVVVGLASLCGIVFVPFHLGSVSTFAPPPEHLVPLTAALPDPAPEWSGARHLIVVAGHAVYTAAGRDEHALSDEASWYLEPFQHAVLTRSLSLSLTLTLTLTLTRYLEPFQHGQLGTMLSHIQRGVRHTGLELRTSRPQAGLLLTRVSLTLDRSHSRLRTTRRSSSSRVARRAPLPDHAPRPAAIGRPRTPANGSGGNRCAAARRWRRRRATPSKTFSSKPCVVTCLSPLAGARLLREPSPLSRVLPVYHP